MEEDDIELSPGFFDVNNNDNDDNDNDNNDNDNEDVNNLIPERISLESPAKNNVLVDLFFLVFTTSDPSCGCAQKGWARTATY